MERIMWDFLEMRKEFKVYLALLGFANREAEACPPIALLASQCCLSRDTVSRHLKKLEDLGVIERTRGRGRGKTTTFRLPKEPPERGE